MKHVDFLFKGFCFSGSKVGLRLFLLLLLAFSGLESRAQVKDFVTGADLGWLTESESRGHKVYNSAGEAMEGTALMKSFGMEAVRIRVWVDPIKHGNWCSKEDALNKALRAKALGMDVMIDFHYSDWWADPKKQNIPAAWSGHSYEEMKEDVRAHTIEVLEFLKAFGVEPRWVQVGNETTHGFLWSVKSDPATGWPAPDGEGNIIITEDMARAETNPEHYAGLFQAGYEAVKQVCPEATVIVHLDDGFDRNLYDWNLGILRDHGAKFDMVGMSLYPYWALEENKRDSAEATITECMENIKHVAKEFGCDVMLVEVGMDALNPEEGYRQLSRIIREAKENTEGYCRGIFYWEPECKPSQYRLGAFSEDGHPTKIMQAFEENR